MEPKLTTCKNCGNLFAGNYCNRCGEKAYAEHDRSLVHFFEEGFHFITHFDGKLFNSLRLVFTKPGQLSADYCFGIRKRYFKPLSLFLLLVVVYLLFPVFEGLNMKLMYHMKGTLYGGYATRKVAALMQEHHLTQAQISEAFAHKSEKVSKFLLMVLIPFTALFFWPLTFRKRSYFFDQMVFSAEINSFFLLWGFLLLPLLIMLFEAIYHLFAKAYLPMTDGSVGIVLYTGLCAYAAMASRRFYHLGVAKSIVLAILFCVAHEIIVQGLYKFLLFVTVINQIH
jgi:hypothetical protein